VRGSRGSAVRISHVARTKMLHIVIPATVFAISVVYLMMYTYNILGSILGILMVLIIDIIFFSWYFAIKPGIYEAFSMTTLLFIMVICIFIGLSMGSLFFDGIAIIIFAAILSYLYSTSNKPFRYNSIIWFEIVIVASSLYVIDNRYIYYLTTLALFILNSLILLKLVKRIQRANTDGIMHLFEDLIVEPFSKTFSYLLTLTPLVVIVISILYESGASLSENTIFGITALIGSLLLIPILGKKLCQCGIDIFQFSIVSLVSYLFSSLEKALWELKTSRLSIRDKIITFPYIGTLIILSIIALLIPIVVCAVLFQIFQYLSPLIALMIVLIITVSMMLSILIPLVYTVMLLYIHPQSILALIIQDPLASFAAMYILLIIFIHTPLLCSIHHKDENYECILTKLLRYIMKLLS